MFDLAEGDSLRADPGPTRSSGVRRKNNYFDGIPVTKSQKIIFFVIMLAYFFEQMDNWNWGFIAPAVFKTWNLSHEASNQAMGHIVFWYFLGTMAGGLLGGIISDYIGRRKTFLLSIGLFTIASIINGLPIESMELFIAARTLTGFGAFALMICSQGYIAEMAPAETRGKWQSLVAAIGFCAVPLIAWMCRVIVPMSSEAWRFIFYLGGLGFVALAFASRYLKESPRWLVAQGRVADAEKVVFEITGHRVDLSDAARHQPPKSSFLQNVKEMFSGKYIKRSMLLMLVFVTTTPALFLLVIWTAKLLAGIPELDPVTGSPMVDGNGQPVMVYTQASMLTLMTLINVGTPVGLFLASAISDMGGRKIPLMITQLLTAVAYVAFGLNAANFYVAAACGFFASVFAMAACFILYAYTAESYPTQVRNTAVGIQNAVARIAVSSSNLAIPLILASFGGVASGGDKDLPVMFGLGAVLMAIPAVAVFLFGERTGGKSLEEIS
ncbi:MFS transporter [Cupriavidus metallidurans]|uniref:MFS transporter n=1 Tax=Cupriavidus metallidurans TaxID=119219 RepID=A0A482IY78_9BURK|nr:MFS transporter [Cupriavidus metallidurans]QBP12513.1 MFS transporter [Cupriavidus metallidurans]